MFSYLIKFIRINKKLGFWHKNGFKQCGSNHLSPLITLIKLQNFYDNISVCILQVMKNTYNFQFDSFVHHFECYSSDLEMK